MATYRLSVSLDVLGLDVVQGERVRVEKRRSTIADTYPPINNLNYFEKATDVDGKTFFMLEPDDNSTHHVAKIFDLAGIPIYEKPFSMPPRDVNLEDSAIGVTIGGSLIQFQDEGVDIGTPLNVRYVNFVGRGVTASYADTEATITINGGSTGFVAITDINPTNPSDNVGNKVLSDDDYVLQSCVSSTTGVTVSVIAVTGQNNFKPAITVNGVAATLIRNTNTDVWAGTAAITLTGTSPYAVTATHGDGATDTAIVTTEAAPVVSSVLFSNAYSQGVGQTEHAAGQTLNLTVTSATPFVQLEVIGDGTTATDAVSDTFATTTSKVLTVTVANHGNTLTAYPAKVRIRNANGTWSAITASNAMASVDGVNVINLNNTRPVIVFGAITYPVGQSALKDAESATVVVTETDVNTVAYSSPNSQLFITAPTALGNKTVSRIAGGYNISTNNLQVIAGRTANATSATFSMVVWIAHDTPTAVITTPAARLRSGVVAQNHTITLTFSQRVASPSLTASVGTFIGAWSTADNGVTWTRTLQIADSDTKGAATFSGLSTTNLANIPVTVITSGASYTVGGFVQRTITFAAWTNRESAIGTQVSDASKLRVTNLSKGASGSLNTAFVGSVGDAVDTYTITQPAGVFNATGNLLYNRDLANAVSNTSGTAQFEIEEIV